MDKNKRKAIISYIAIAIIFLIIGIIVGIIIDKNNSNDVENNVLNNEYEGNRNGVVGGSNPNIWKECKFTIEGIEYQLLNSYNKFLENDWSLDLVAQGYGEGYKLDVGKKTGSNIKITKNNNLNVEVYLGLENTSENEIDITESSIYYFKLDNTYTDTPITFVLPGGIKNGNTLAEVESIYGRPQNEDYINRVDELYKTIYTYYDNGIKFLITVDDYRGVIGFEYEKMS